MTQESTVFVVEDDAQTRDLLVRLLAREGLSVQAYADAPAFLEGYTPGHGGCLVLDVCLPGMTGLELQRELKNRDISLPVIVLTGQADVPMAVEALKSGAIDFIQKPFEHSDLCERVREALDRDAKSREAQLERGKIGARLAMLTPREREVMDLVVQGNSNREVAATLGVSTKTVEVHRANVMSKMAARSLAELVRMALCVGGRATAQPAAARRRG